MTSTPGPYDNVAVGTMLFTLVEPHRGHEVAYNRWYERDHMLAGCLIGPGWFSARRWVATAADKATRVTTPDGMVPDPSVGSYLATYWVQAGEDGPAIEWASQQVKRLHDEGRMFDERDHVHTLMYVHRFDADRDAEAVPTALALAHPYASLATVAVRRPAEVDRRAFTRWLHQRVGEHLPGGPLAKVVGFTPIPLPDGAPVDQRSATDEAQRVLLLVFSEAHPEATVDAVASLNRHLTVDGIDGGPAPQVSFAGVFRPTIPGTDTYTNQLW
ncbi:MAG: hypothetical protein JJU45_11170 [Acidimicrobiia bacterium]|nr:hypothetical protein [Acidimicrobiia bacterium]